MGTMARTGQRIFLRISIVFLSIVIYSTPVGATEDDMLLLPLTETFRCLACHLLEAPTADDATLNVFGADFLANQRIWDAELARADADGDGCTNGVEIGDADGDGAADGNVTEQADNPGVADDCGNENQIDEKTWSELKFIFDGN